MERKCYQKFTRRKVFKKVSETEIYLFRWILIALEKRLKRKA